ncbi:nuclear transport factor 2 family protein [Spirosoma pollinicola]|uniref:DUF4440 domain-containing protein n=1 Tax=Spirosoma pollinicola TaxID=2057025 RepID=A0A2K8Z7A8_9BACT|nr:nuclear transport factor 2 family protein [Spirosoma pollinicola]AUD05777.1 hypothetical protein CWM47_30385 [Spirosoma pollinicola]
MLTQKPIHFVWLVGTFIGLALVRCNAPAPSSDTHSRTDMVVAKKIIQDKTSRFTNAHITGDTAFLNNIFTTDARIFAPGSAVVTGRRSIEAINAEYVSYGISEFREEITALYGSGDYLISEGPYLMRYGKDNTTEKGNYLNVWKQENGDWKLYANIWNTSAPQ